MDIPKYSDNYDHTYHLYVIKVEKRDKLISYLKSKGISTAVHFEPLPLQPLYKIYKAKIPIAKKEWLKIISLPLFPDLKLSKVDFIIRELKNFDKNFEKY